MSNTMLSPPQGGGHDADSPLEEIVVQHFVALNTTATIRPLLAIVRLDHCDAKQIKNKDVAIELTQTGSEVTFASDVQPAIRRLETMGWIDVDRSEKHGAGNDIRLSEWGQYAVSQLRIDTWAHRFDADADVPADLAVPPLPETGDSRLRPSALRSGDGSESNGTDN